MQPLFADIQSAADRLRTVVHRTPTLRSRQLEALAGCEIFLKAENLQRAGSFKIRGAYNKISQLDDQSRRRGVIAYSSGNHAQGVALAARLLGIPATIVVPATIAESKRAATAAYGASLQVAGTSSAERRAQAEELAEEHGLVLVPPYDDVHVIAGQGTVALELLQDVADLDVLVAPIGGGGLMAGCAIASRALRPGVRLIGVEPHGADDTARSLAAGQRQRISDPMTIADGLRAVEPGEMTFDILRQLIDDVVLVTDDEITAAVRLLLERCKLLVEPSGAVALAAVLSGAVCSTKQRVGVVLSGGNVDLARLTQLMVPNPAGGPSRAP